eukprot:6188490-Pleurochrysis_carterae.AAC.2
MRAPQVFEHPAFNTVTFANDVALLRLAAPVDYVPVVIATPDMAATMAAAGSTLTVAGWGVTSDGQSALSDQARRAPTHIKRRDSKVLQLGRSSS